MKTETLTYRDWTFEFDKQLTSDTYALVKDSGADSCICENSGKTEPLIPE